MKCWKKIKKLWKSVKNVKKSTFWGHRHINGKSTQKAAILKNAKKRGFFDFLTKFLRFHEKKILNVAKV
jgi:hypothetical protein